MRRPPSKHALSSSLLLCLLSHSRWQPTRIVFTAPPTTCASARPSSSGLNRLTLTACDLFTARPLWAHVWTRHLCEQTRSKHAALRPARDLSSCQTCRAKRPISPAARRTLDDEMDRPISTSLRPGSQHRPYREQLPQPARPRLNTPKHRADGFVQPSAWPPQMSPPGRRPQHSSGRRPCSSPRRRNG